MGEMSDLSQTSFDDWYTAIGRSGGYDAAVARGLGLPAGLTATGLVSGAAFPEVLAALALGPGELLLDLACGRGSYGLAAARAAGAHLLGVDFSAVALSQAQVTAETIGMADRARFALGEMTATGVPAGCVDAVMCLDSIQFAPSTRAAAEECRRVLVPGGRLVLTCWQAAGPRVEQLPERIRHLDVAGALQESGFEEVTAAERPDWLVRERRHWESVLGLEAGDDPGLQALREEAGEVLPMLPHLRRLLVRAVAPAGSRA